MLYSEDLASEYTNKRKSYAENDNVLVNAIESVGVMGKVVLDIGSGDGNVDQLIMKAGAARLIGIDTSDKMVEIARSNNSDPNVSFIKADAQQLPNEDKSIDIVTTNFVLHYFIDTTPVFREIARVLKDDGRYVGVFNITDVASGYEHLYNTQMPLRLGESVVLLNLIKSRKEVEASIDAAGLSIVKYEELGHDNSVVDDSFPDKAHLRKAAVLMILRKK